MPRPVRWLPQARWKRWLVVLAITGALLAMLAISLVVTAVLLWRNPRVQGWVMVQVLRLQSHQPGEAPGPPHLSRAEEDLLLTQASTLSSAEELFRPTNVWDVQLRFTSNQWAQLGPNVVPPVLPFLRADGSVILLNPQATRNGLAGVFGMDFPWSEAALQFGDKSFGPVGARFKGNGTFVNSQRSYKRPFKVDLHKRLKSQRLGDCTILNFHNLTSDSSCLSDALAYEFFREAGVPSPRTALARLRLSIEGKFSDRLLGLYVLVENPDRGWAREFIGEGGAALFKPVTYELFNDLGNDWKAYERIYDPKTKLQPGQAERLIALAKLVTHGSDAEFARQIGQFVDLDEFARFLACQVILSNYDGFLSNGQNFLLYLDGAPGRFGFIPWDLDQCWGKFTFIGSIDQRERASVWHPWVGRNRFLERMLSAPPVRQRYREELERIRATLFQPERLCRRLDELARVVRPFIAEESPKRLARFERETGELPGEGAKQVNGRRPGPRGFNYRQFFAARAESVSDQLAGKTEGVILNRRSNH